MSIENLEILCKQLYEATDNNVRNTAEKSLLQFTECSDCMSKCQSLLERAASPYAQLIAASTLSKLVAKKEMLISIQDRLQIRNYVLMYLASRRQLENYVVQALVQLFCRITKLGWFDSNEGDEEWPFRNIMDPVNKFIQSGQTDGVLIGVQLLSNLVNEINQMSEVDITRTVLSHRKISSSFRDVHLFNIFRLGCSLLSEAASNLKSLNFNDTSQHGVVMQSLKLVFNCLSFDFIGTASDDSSDDLCTVQIPTSWRAVFLETDTVQLFFDLYAGLPSSLSCLSLSCLVQISSIRRSLFNNTERSKFLNTLVYGVKKILQNPSGLAESSNYHEFCRLVARLKSNYQLGELVKVDSYSEFIKLIADFTIRSLEMVYYDFNSVHYLLNLWQRMVASIPYVKAAEPHLLELHTPDITKAYVESRLKAVGVIFSDGADDPLDDFTSLSQQLDQISIIGRCEYEKTCRLLVMHFDQSASSYEKALGMICADGSISTDARQLLAVEHSKLTWLVYIIGTVIGGRVSFTSTDEHDALDGELVCRVLQLMQVSDARLANRPISNIVTYRLDLAILSFFENFRRIYIGDNVQKTSKVYKCLSQVLGLSDEGMILSVFIGKIMTNLRYWSQSDIIVSKTLALLNELSVGYSSVRKLVKLSAVQFMLVNHTSEHFPFLNIQNCSSMHSGSGDGSNRSKQTSTSSESGRSRSSSSMSSSDKKLSRLKFRTTFYTAIGRLLMVNLSEDEERFLEFMEPLTNTFNSLTHILMQNNVFQVPEEVKLTLVGLARDLRGIAFSLNTKVSFMMLFDWLYPNYSALLIRTLSLWHNEPAVTSPILKLYAEISQNRSNRLQFDVSSPNGILLFKEISKVIVTYGSNLLSSSNNDMTQKGNFYTSRLKGIAICFSMLKAGLSGNYVNFGVFKLYGDDALDKVLEMFIKLLLSIPQSDLLDYPKLSQSYYTLLECLSHDHMLFLAALDPQVVMYILATISEGLTSLDTTVCSGCCSTLDNILSFIFKIVQRKKRPHRNHLNGSSGAPATGAGNSTADLEEKLISLVDMQPGVLHQMLNSLLNTIMYEECRSQWSMSRPLLTLILLNEKYFTELRDSIINSQPSNRQMSMMRSFESLMEGIECSLLTKNRDKFTQNLSVFRRDIVESIKGNVSSTSASNNLNNNNNQLEMMT